MIAVEITFTEQDYVRVTRFMASPRTKTFKILLALGGLVGTLLIYRGVSDFRIWEIPVIVGLFVPLYYLARFIQRLNIGRQVKSVPGSDDVYTFTFSEEGITISGSLRSANLKWEAIVKVRESESDFLFYTTKRFAQFLPKRAFRQNEEMKELRVLLGRQLGNRAQLLT
jgi:hypothetical protein